MKHLVALCLLLSATVGLSQKTHKRTLSAREIAGRSLKSVVILVTQDASGKAVSLGSGFFVAPDVVVTNYHVVKKAEKVLIKLPQDREFCEALVVGAFEEDDLSFLFVTGIQGPPLQVVAQQPISVGDVVYVVGNPEGLEGTFSQGIVSALRGNLYFQISAPISHGSSGGPVLNQQGEVIGVATLTSRQGQNLNFAVRASTIQYYLRSSGGPMLYAARNSPGKGNLQCGISLDSNALTEKREHP